MRLQRELLTQSIGRGRVGAQAEPFVALPFDLVYFVLDFSAINVRSVVVHAFAVVTEVVDHKILELAFHSALGLSARQGSPVQGELRQIADRLLLAPLEIVPMLEAGLHFLEPFVVAGRTDQKVAVLLDFLERLFHLHTIVHFLVDYLEAIHNFTDDCLRRLGPFLGPGANAHLRPDSLIAVALTRLGGVLDEKLV